MKLTIRQKLKLEKKLNNEMICPDCKTIMSKNEKAPFFREKREGEKMATFYCGCKGWD